MPTTMHRVKAQVEPTNIPSQSIGFAKEKLSVQSAVATVPPTLKYVTFATAYGTTPSVAITESGSTSFRTSVGTYRADVIRVRPGSFGWAGTPSLKFRWSAFGQSG